jgi:hypothetical protein
MFTPIIKEALANKDLTIINKMYKSVNQHKIYKDQASDLAVKMGKFMNKFVSDMITSEDISEWRKITVECNKILEKMGNLPFADKQEYYKQTRNENKTGLQYAEIVDRCNGSKKMLGL